MSPKLSPPVFKYILSGGVAFVVDYVFLNVGFYVLGMPLAGATTFGFLSGLIVSFYANRFWVHGQKGRDRRQLSQLIEYTSLVMVNYFFTILAISLLYKWGLAPYASKVIVMIMITCWNYVIFSKVIFRKNVK